MIKEITTTCPFCGKTHDYEMVCHTEEQAEAWEKLMRDFAGALCSCDTTPLAITPPKSREEMAQKHKAVYFRRQAKLYTVECIYTKIRYDFTLPNAKGDDLTVEFVLNFCEDGQINLRCSAVASNEKNGLVKFDAPDGWEYYADDYCYGREITDVYLCRENLDKIATECYQKFMRTR